MPSGYGTPAWKNAAVAPHNKLCVQKFVTSRAEGPSSELLEAARGEGACQMQG